MADRDDHLIDFEEYEATLGARQHLGAELEPAVVESFAAKIEKVVDERAKMLSRSADAKERLARSRMRYQLALGIISIVVAVPLSIPAAIFAQFPGVLVTWLGIGLVNLALPIAGRFKDAQDERRDH
ncbi:hypothetical protein [Parenemella sanctibonifatiensis]|uniref:DUF2335 domain-containing protein n=1 Tax=Parenemella sanctibonifatiensis TaxID=2016505 RepID=A0A255EBY1_9ACTN|nr:hypothetical protein [Parenemella sanctibonifatiensis]OYN88770.1 hypothetical protein CGZ92_03420 [Parenemella sanctibonifatiensis]